MIGIEGSIAPVATATVVLSLLHELAERHSATHTFRGQPVLAWTLERLARADRVGQVIVICWDDQQGAVNEVASAAGARVLVKSPRVPVPAMDAISAAQRWSDGWRGGLLGTCHFDRGFFGPFVQDALAALGGAAGSLIVLIDPAAGLVDPALIDAMVAHADERPEREFFFSQAAPGLSGVAIRPALLQRLAQAGAHPGRLLAYLPDLPGMDPITSEMCVPVTPAIARTTLRFSLDSERQVAWLSTATAALNGQLIGTGAEGLLETAAAQPASDAKPREVVLELTARRASRPVFAATTHLELGRGDMPLETVRSILEQLRRVDDLRLTLAGAGDPLLHPEFPEIVRLIGEARIPAVHVETDLLELSEESLAALRSGVVDVVSVHLPAACAPTYERVMGIDGFTRVVENFKRLLTARRTLPLIVPTFVKCPANLEEMEVWYDHWIRLLGAAVVTGPTDFAGQIPDSAVADMSPPRRRACARLQSRMTVHSDGAIPSCEQDVMAKQCVGHASRDSLGDAWQQNFAAIRNDHRLNTLDERPICRSCREWHRP